MSLANNTSSSSPDWQASGGGAITEVCYQGNQITLNTHKGVPLQE